jgi:hypothetical protein
MSIVTVGTKIQQTIASPESITANLKEFALYTDNQQVMSEEPQYNQ